MPTTTHDAIVDLRAAAPAEAAVATRPPLGLSICIPVFNEEGAVGETLRRCLALGEALGRAGVDRFEVIAVDDGSGDRTADVIAGYPHVRLIRHEGNRGYGAALKTAFAAARHDLIGFLDADATYPPEQFPLLCEAVIRNHADLVIGTRMSGADSDMPRVRRIGNAFFAGMLTLIGRTPVTDSASGMRVFRRKTLHLLSPLPDGLNLTPVMSTRAVHEGIIVAEVPIPYCERVGPSKLSITRDGIRFLTTMVTTALAYNPVRIFGIAGLAGIGLSAAVFAGLVYLRATGVTTLGPVGTFAVFGALVSGVAGVSIFALGATFNYLVSLFYDRPIRQGLFKKPLLTGPVERLFLPAGLASGLSGLLVAAGAFVLARRGWPIERLWMYLTASAMAILIGVQLTLWWLMASVLRELSARRVVNPQDQR
ncbi:MAG: glycosyltransferase family 2 protein [Vicinamibacterales bacterium]